MKQRNRKSFFNIRKSTGFFLGESGAFFAGACLKCNGKYENMLKISKIQIEFLQYKW